MFENMMKYEKAWDKFCKWGIKYDMDCMCELAVLGLIPFFMDEQGIYIEVHHYAIDSFSTKIYKKNNKMFIDFIAEFIEGTRQEALIKASEKAFEIF